MFFGNIDGLIRVVVVGACAYWGLILVLRVAGKRSLAKLNAFDFAVTVAIGSTLATVLLSKDVPLAEGLLAFVMLAVLQYIVSKGSVMFPPFKRVVRSEPVQLVIDGRYLDAVLRRQRVTPSEVDAAIRKQGVGRIEEVAAVVLETDGSFSVIRADGGGEMTTLRSVQQPGSDAQEPKA